RAQPCPAPTSSCRNCFRTEEPISLRLVLNVFISLCADRAIANIALGASLNCQQPFRSLLCRSTLRQGCDEARDHELHSNDTDCAHVSDAHFLTSFGM